MNIKNKNLKIAINLAINILGVVLILFGLSLFIWIGRPYATLYLLTGQKKALAKKAQLPAGKIKGDRIIIPSVLVDAPIIEGFTEENLRHGVTHISNSAYPGGKGNIILAGHNYSSYWISNAQNLFSLLHLIKKGAPIYIYYHNRKYVYETLNKTTKPRDDPKVFALTRDNRLTLVASASSWSVPMVSSVRRLVVVAKGSR